MIPMFVMIIAILLGFAFKAIIRQIQEDAYYHVSKKRLRHIMEVDMLAKDRDTIVTDIIKEYPEKWKPKLHYSPRRPRTATEVLHEMYVNQIWEDMANSTFQLKQEQWMNRQIQEQRMQVMSANIASMNCYDATERALENKLDSMNNGISRMNEHLAKINGTVFF